MIKYYWLQTMAHIYAQSVAMFLGGMMAIIVLLIRHDIKKETNGNLKK